MSLTSVIKAQSLATQGWPFPHLCEANKRPLRINANRKWFRKWADANKQSLKRSGLSCAGTWDLPNGNIDWGKKAPKCKVWFSNGPKVKSRRAICIPSGWPLINIGRRTLVRSGNSQMVRLRDAAPELRAQYHLLPSHLIPFDQNNCHLSSLSSILSSWVAPVPFSIPSGRL